MNGLQVFLILAPLAAVSTLFTFIYSVIQRPMRLVWFSLFLLCCFLILIFQILELTSTDPLVILVFSRMTYAVIAFYPVFWFLFSLEFVSGYGKLSKKLVIALCLLPLATVLVACTDSYHHLLWQQRSFRQVGTFTVNTIQQYGPWFWVHCTYTYGLFLAGAVKIAWESLHHHKLYRRQGYCVLVGCAVPVLVNLIYVFRVFGPADKDFSSLGLAVSGLCFIVGMKRYSLNKIRPPLSHGMIDWLDEVVLVLDDRHHVVDLNRCAELQFGVAADDLLGQPVQTLLPGLGPEFPLPGDFNRSHMVYWLRHGQGYRGELRLRNLKGRGGGGAGASLTISHVVPAAPGETGNKPSIKPLLSRREFQVLELVVKKYSNKEIATQLNVTESTVKAHVHCMLKKTGLGQRRNLSMDLFEP